MLAGPLGGPADVEDVVEELEREADQPAEAAERGRPPRLALAQRARRLEQPRGLQLAAVQVALLGDPACPTRPRAGAARPRPARRTARDSTRTSSASPLAASSENARAKRWSPVTIAASRPALAQTVGRPRRSARRVEHVVVDERRGVDELDRRGGADQPRPRRPRPRPAASRTSSGRRRLPPAAIVALGPAGDRVAGGGRDLAQPLLDARRAGAGGAPRRPR